MNKTCQDCKYWMTEVKNDLQIGEADDARCCELISYTDYHKPDWNNPKHAFIGVSSDDGGPVAGELFTRPTFGCNLWESK
jgi:hypothetical protein